MWNQQTRAEKKKKTDALAGYSLCTAALFSILGTRLKKRLWHFFFFLSICLRSQGFITPSCFDHIRNDKCPNGSRRIMPFVASAVPFWFFAGKYALENSSTIL